MLFVTLASLALAGSSAAVPLLTPRAPPTQPGRGFKLIVNVTGTDFADGPVHGREVATAHTGASTSRATATASSQIVFYQNGTDAEADSWQLQLVSDTAGFSQGAVIDWEAPGTQYPVSIDAAPPTKGLQMSPPTKDVSFVDLHGRSPPSTPGGFIVCKEQIPEIPGQTFDAISFHVVDETPADCVAVTLVPQCAELPGLPADSPANRNFVREVRCYPDVKSVNWGA